MSLLERIKPKRKILGMSAVFLPFTRDGAPDLEAFQAHLKRTQAAGLVPAVNMDTGFGPQLGPKGRAEILRITRQALGPGPRFIAGAMPFGHDGAPLEGYHKSIRSIVDLGGTPIIFPSPWLGEGDIAKKYAEITVSCDAALAFELGPMFAPFGRIFDLDTFRRLLELPKIQGLKHSSLDRSMELERLELRDRQRPDFKVYTGNDLAIDMVMYGSDYLLGLSTFDPAAFARRDRLWELGDDRFFALNDALQALGHVAFREPVPAYKTSAATYLNLTGQLKGAFPHPECAPRPAWESDLLRPFADRLGAELRRTTPD